jgi:hypothetical protein
MKLTWTYLFEPTLTGLRENTLELVPGDLAVAHTFLTKVARVLQESSRSWTINDIEHDESIKILWNGRHLKVFCTLVFCSVGWLTLLYEPLTMPNAEILLLAHYPNHTHHRTMESQINLPLHKLIWDIGAQVPVLYLRLPINRPIL